mmetsp:Transcript_39112/g.126458  ORF Transcript_39112/g.126458 Transcript_39112/m.126458 type:complete len:384 (-) Transcript_39112:47-1198(-)
MASPDPTTTPPPHFCSVCSLDLQSARALAEHCSGRKHQRKLWRCATAQQPSNAKRPELFHMRQRLTEDDFFDSLAAGRFRNIVVCSGAGISTAAGIADFRSVGGLFSALQSRFGERFPIVHREPETLLSRSFATQHADVWRDEIEPFTRSWKRDGQGAPTPTPTHVFCKWLHERGWLRRIYTQNVDGLHTHESLVADESAAGFREKVVEVHGALHDASIVLYGDPLPPRFFEAVRADFDRPAEAVDLMLVIGTALQVAPFCAVPNLAPSGATRVLINRCLADAMRNDWSRSAAKRFDMGCYGSSGGMVACTTTKLAGRDVSLRPKWGGHGRSQQWDEALIEDESDAVVERFFDFLRGNGRSASGTESEMSHLSKDMVTLDLTQ